LLLLLLKIMIMLTYVQLITQQRFYLDIESTNNRKSYLATIGWIIQWPEVREIAFGTYWLWHGDLAINHIQVYLQFS